MKLDPYTENLLKDIAEQIFDDNRYGIPFDLDDRYAYTHIRNGYHCWIVKREHVERLKHLPPEVVEELRLEYPIIHAALTQI